MKRFHERSSDYYVQETTNFPRTMSSSLQPKRLQYESSTECVNWEPNGKFLVVRESNLNGAEEPLRGLHEHHSSSDHQFKTLTAMIDQCSHLELVHLHKTIKSKLKRDFFALLPAEIVFRILSYLSLHDILHCAQVSRHWNQVTNDSLLWFRLYHHSRNSEMINDKVPSKMTFTCQAASQLDNCTPQELRDSCAQRASVLDNTIGVSEMDWKSVYRSSVETRCNWRNGSPWTPVILPAHHNHVITCLEVYNDWAITASDDASICVWNLCTNQLLISLFGHLGGVWSLVVLPPLPQSSLDDPNNMINRMPLLVSGSCDRSARVWLLDGTHWPCITTLYGHQSTVRCVAGQADRVAAKNSSSIACAYETGEWPLQSEYTGEKNCWEPNASLESESNFEKLRLVVTGSRDTTLRLWDAHTGCCLRVFQGHLGAVRCVQFCGPVIVSGSYDCTIRLWSVRTGNCLRVLHGHRNRVYTLLFDGRYIISASLDTTIRVWDGLTGRLEHTFCGHQSLTSEMAYAAAQRILVSSNADETIRVWDVASGECVHVLAGSYKHHSAVTCVQLSHNFIISSSDDGTVKLWDRDSGAYIRDLVRLDGAGRGAVIWRIVASETRLVCAAGSRSGIENTKLIVLRFDEPTVDPTSPSASHKCRPKVQSIPMPSLSQVVSSHVFLSDDSLSDSLIA